MRRALEVVGAHEALAVLHELPVELGALAKPVVLPLMGDGELLERGEPVAHLDEILHQRALALPSLSAHQRPCALRFQSSHGRPTVPPTEASARRASSGSR